MLNDAAAVEAHMRGWPDAIFIKPVAGAFGEEAMALDRDSRGWRDGTRRWTDAEIAALLLGRQDPAGTLIQPRLRNDAELRRISCGDGLCATRIITALTVDGPGILVTVHKLLGRDVIADNFSAGLTGNLLALVEPVTGEVIEAYGRRSGHRFLLTRYRQHPTTGAQLAGFRLPHWEATRQLALQVAGAFPELPLLGHDIVISEEGPLFLETNTHWRISLPQLALGGLRPILRELIPRLAVPSDVRTAALASIG